MGDSVGATGGMVLRWDKAGEVGGSWNGPLSADELGWDECRDVDPIGVEPLDPPG